MNTFFTFLIMWEKCRNRIETFDTLERSQFNHHTTGTYPTLHTKQDNQSYPLHAKYEKFARKALNLIKQALRNADRVEKTAQPNIVCNPIETWQQTVN